MNVDFRPVKDFNKFGDNSEWKSMDATDGADIYFNWLETNTIPLSSSSIDNIYTSCSLTFIFPVNFPILMSEFYRILKEGGLIRIAVPDFELGARYYIGKNQILCKKPLPHSPLLPPTLLGYLQAWGATSLIPNDTNKYTRRISLDFETLKWYLEQAGFVDIVRKEHNICSDIFKGRDFDRNMSFVLYIEAVKPVVIKVEDTNVL